MSIGTILSGVQPTGSLNLGNYLGAIRNWVRMQAQYRCYFMIADLHAITVPQDPATLRANTLETAAAYIACGIDPERSVIFVQSHAPAHAELAWVLGCNTPLGWLNRMTQFKEKSGKDKENAPLGLFSYPVLMAADILAYRATHVPVGEDQKQHLELTRDIAGAFNRNYGKELFPLPEPVIMADGARVMSLRDGTKKMSKSDPSDYARINLTDDADAIAKKFQKAKSDMLTGITYDEAARPEASNLITIYAALTEEPREAILARMAEYSFSTFKKELADVAVAYLEPITAKMRDLMANQDYLTQLMHSNAEKARAVTSETWRDVKEIVGFLV